MVPDGSPFTVASTLLGILPSLSSQLRAVRLAATATAWATGTEGLYAAVRAIEERLPVTSNVGLLERDSYDDLGKYNFIDGIFWNHDIEDRASSLLLVSASRPISFFQHDDLGGDELTVDAVPAGLERFGGAVVRQLHSNTPQSSPPGCVEQTGTAGGGWGDMISSYRWGPERVPRSDRMANA